MMLSRFFITAALAATLLLAACQSTAPPETSVETLATPSATVEPESLPATPSELNMPPPPTDAATTRWLETEMNGIQLGMWRPDGWETDVSDGLVLAENNMSASGLAEGGILVYVFVPPMSEFVVHSDDANYALTVLNQVVKMPSHTGRDLVMSQPVGFEWDGYQAAYYLVSTGDGVRALVLALAIPGVRKVVVCNVSIAAAQADRIRAALPWLLDGLMIEGKPLRGASLDALPDPLPFPRYSRTSTTVNNRVGSGDSP